MAWGGSGVSTQWFVDALAGTITVDLASGGDTIYLALYNNTVTPDYDATAANFAYGAGTWSGNELTGTGWSAGGVALTSQALATASPAAGQWNFDTADVSETGTSVSNFYGCLVYDGTLATPVADQGIFAVDFGQAYSTVAGTLTITVAANGWFYFDCVP